MTIKLPICTDQRAICSNSTVQIKLTILLTNTYRLQATTSESKVLNKGKTIFSVDFWNDRFFSFAHDIVNDNL